MKGSHLPNPGVLEITLWEPPRSGWTMRVAMLRRGLEECGIPCEILDIGPSRRLERAGITSVHGPIDYLRKVLRCLLGGVVVVHGHINGRYHKGVVLVLTAALLSRLFGKRVVTTFHGGCQQPLLELRMERGRALTYRILFLLSHAIVCNSRPVADRLAELAPSDRIHPIQPFSAQYLEEVESSCASVAEIRRVLKSFAADHRPLIVSYLAFREEFCLDALLEGLVALSQRFPELGVVLIGTGPERSDWLAKAERMDLLPRMMVIDHLDRGQILAALAASDLLLRTPPTDGVSAVVLEALSLGVPVVAAENGQRPPSVVTYPSNDGTELARIATQTLAAMKRGEHRVERPTLSDTVPEELALLLGERAISSRAADDFTKNQHEETRNTENVSAP